MLLNSCVTSGLENNIVVQLLIIVGSQIQHVDQMLLNQGTLTKLLNSWSTVDLAAKLPFSSTVD